MAHCLNRYRQKVGRRLATRLCSGSHAQHFLSSVTRASSSATRSIVAADQVPDNNHDWFLRVRQLLGCAGYLTSKFETSPSLKRARRSFLKGPPSSAGDSVWVADCSFDELCQVMGNSWAGTKTIEGEPIKAWITSHVGYPDQETKILLSRYFMGSSIAEAMRSNGIVLGSTVDGRIASAMIISEHNNGELSYLNRKSSNSQHARGHDSSPERDFLGQLSDFIWELCVTLRLANLDVPALLACNNYQKEQARSSAKASVLGDSKKPHRHENHAVGTFWNVQMVAVNPEHQGQGHGQELMKRLGQLADEADMTCYLEAAGEKNPFFYQQQGFTQTSRVCVTDPTDADGLPLQVTMMMRVPNRRA